MFEMIYSKKKGRNLPRRWPRRIVYVIAGIIIVLIGVRLALPHELKSVCEPSIEPIP